LVRINDIGSKVQILECDFFSGRLYLLLPEVKRPMILPTCFLSSVILSITKQLISPLHIVAIGNGHVVAKNVFQSILMRVAWDSVTYFSKLSPSVLCSVAVSCAMAAEHLRLPSQQNLMAHSLFTS
jgi:hypothetical protein